MNILINSEAIFAQLPDGKMVRFEDQHSVRELLWSLQEDPQLQLKTYPLPENYEIVIQWQFKFKDGHTWYELHNEEKETSLHIETRQVARLVKRTGENSAHSYTEGSEASEPATQSPSFVLSTLSYDKALEDAEKSINELLAQKFGLLNENQFYLLDSKEVIQELQKLKNG